MPYIKEERRKRYDDAIQSLASMLGNAGDDEVDGDTNYVISRIVSGAFGFRGWRYRLAARALAVFECAKLEFYRCVVAPYEDKAIAKNNNIPEYQR